MTNKVQRPSLPDDSLNNVRELLIGRDNQFVEEKLGKEAKGLVTDVVSEALLSRESKDGSVNKVLVPLVEKSLHRSIEANSDKIVGTLYPLVGSLVRRAFSAFIIEFVERTNALIENSLSPKSLSWRFKAWQSGIKYSEFVAAQIYQYQVQQLLVIHRETGTLLHSVSADPDKQKDADLISSMLVAINDFVADAFGVSSNEADNDLGEIKTDDFTLLIKVGPQAILVAAVTGSVPPDIRGNLQKALEEFHQFYQSPLVNYDGDNTPFDGCETILSDCLVSERKEEEARKSKSVIGIIVLIAIMGVIAAVSYTRISLNILKNELQALPTEPGLVVTNTYIADSKIHTKVFRDPSVISVENWLLNNDIDVSRISVTEEPFISLTPSVVESKLQALLSAFPINERESLTLTLSPEIAITGRVFLSTATQLTSDIAAIPGADLLDIEMTGLNTIPLSTIDNESLQRAALSRLVDKITAQRISFPTNQADITPLNVAKLESIAQNIKKLASLAKQSNTFVSVVILGASDNSGTNALNEILSQTRAENVVDTLVSLGVKSDLLIAASLGELPLQEPSMGRAVMINVLTSNTQ